MTEGFCEQISKTISRIENITNCQIELDRLWVEIKNMFLTELNKLPNLPPKGCKIGRKKSSPFWNEELSHLWNEVTRTQNEYTK